VPELGGKSFTIPSMATGGVAFDPMLALIGDAGARNPEIVAPQQMMRDTVAEALTMSGAGTVHVETHLHVDGSTDAATFDRMLERASVEITRTVQRELDRQRESQGLARGGLVAA
jgi:hypothetical protein